MREPAKCYDLIKHKTIVREEGGKKVIFDNPNQSDLVVGKVDGCIIDDDSQRCDELAITAEAIYWLEFKGKDVEKAVKQIVASANMLSPLIEARESVPVIVTSRTPAIASGQKYLRLLKNCPNINEKALILGSRKVQVKL